MHGNRRVHLSGRHSLTIPFGRTNPGTEVFGLPYHLSEPKKVDTSLLPNQEPPGAQVCPKCRRPLAQGKKPRRPRGARSLSEAQRGDLGLIAQFGVLLRSQLVALRGGSREAVRCRLRRAKARGLVRPLSVPGGRVAYQVTAKGLTLLGAPEAPREFGHAGLFAHLAMAQYAASGAKVLSHAEFLSVLEALEPTFGDLRVPGLPKRRWATSDGALTFMHVDLTGGEVSAPKIVGRLSARLSKLRKKSAGWAKLAQSGYVRFVVLTPWDREAELSLAAKRASLSVSTKRIVLLRHALGLGEGR